MSKYKSFADPQLLCGKALSQMESAMAQPWAIKGALMPDTHAGYALPIGAVVKTADVVVPSWVGYDIGCGMCAYPLDYDVDEVIANRFDIHAEILKTVPVGFNGHSQALPVDFRGLTSAGETIAKKKAGFQLGTLGGGNHFIELAHDIDRRVWCVIHSGSRGTGHGIATHYMKIAGGGKAREGHYPLQLSSQDGQDYLADLEWSLQYALDNRAHMLNAVNEAVAKILMVKAKKIDKAQLINRNHNHAEVVADGVIHRKGATHAEDGMMGVIPGNMRDGSFIVRGKGNPDSLSSSSHGAGRVLSRSAAKSQLEASALIISMQGIATGDLNQCVDEAPEAYKNIFDVMDLQSDLVEVVHYLKPFLNVKG